MKFRIAGLGVLVQMTRLFSPWPSMSPDLMSCDFYLGYLKDRVYVPPLSTTLIPLRERIGNAVMAIDEMMLQNVWNELD